MVDQQIKVELNIVNKNMAEEEMTKILMDLIKIRLNKYPVSLQMLICNMVINNPQSINKR